jgi:hypothetical protein
MKARSILNLRRQELKQSRSSKSLMMLWKCETTKVCLVLFPPLSARAIDKIAVRLLHTLFHQAIDNEIEKIQMHDLEMKVMEYKNQILQALIDKILQERALAQGPK